MQTAVFLKRQDGFSVNKVALSIEGFVFDRILAFAYSDGSIEYRDRSSLAELFMEGNLQRFSHLSQTGFSYDDEEPCKKPI
jgi:mediator of RNA polymerase II transcription subunit 16